MKEIAYRKEQINTVKRLTERAAASVPYWGYYDHPVLTNYLVIAPARTGMSSVYQSLLVQPKVTVDSPIHSRAKRLAAGGQMGMGAGYVAPPVRFSRVADAVDRLFQLGSELMRQAALLPAGRGKWSIVW